MLFSDSFSCVFTENKSLKLQQYKTVFDLVTKSNTGAAQSAAATNYYGCMNFLFTLFSAGALVSATIVLRSKNPVHAVFYLVGVFLHASGLLCLLDCEYFALLQLLVYVGALAIMFLFVVMLLDIPTTEIIAHQRGTYPAASLLLLCLAMAVTLAVIQPSQYSMIQVPLIGQEILEVSSQPQSTCFANKTSWDVLQYATTPVVQLGIAVYGVHAALLMVASLVLLVAIIGAVALTLKRRVHAPLHDVFAQQNRDFQKVVCTIRSSC